MDQVLSMNAARSNIVIVGAGQAGAQVAASLRSGGYTGRLSLIGDEPSLPYQRPPLSKTYLKDDADSRSVQLRPAPFYQAQGVDLVQGESVVAIDRAHRRLSLSSGREIDYDGLALTTGSRPRPWAVQGASQANVLMLRSVADAERLRGALAAVQSMAIIGGGFIGLEVAACAASMGRRVTVIEAADRLMARAVAPITSSFFLSHHRDLGVSVILGSRVERVEAGGASHCLVLEGGERLHVDLILAGVGGLANDELAVKAGLKCESGIVVDAHALTSDPDIVAAGDCTSQPSRFAPSLVRLESVQNAIDQAKTAAATLLGVTRPSEAVPWFWSDQADAKLQTVGLSISADSFVVRGRPERKKFTVFHLREGVVIAADSVNAAADHMAARQLVNAGCRPDPAVLADLSRPLKELIAL